MTQRYKITRPRARLEAQLVVDPTFSPGFTLYRYEQRRTNARWWQRTVTATDDQWLRMSGRDGTTPADTWSVILDDDRRPVLPLPVLVLADFVVSVQNEVQPETWPLFHWVTWAVDDLLGLTPLPQSAVGGLTNVIESIDAMTYALIDAVLDGSSSIPWPTTDGAQIQTLTRLGALVWSFPSDLVRRVVSTLVALNERHDAPRRTPPDQQTDSVRFGPGQLLQLSGIHLWRTQIPHIRRLAPRMSTFAFPALLQQALVLNHPDAPLIEDADLAHLCDGTIGYETDPPALVQPQYNDAVNLPEFSPTRSRARITAYIRESVMEVSPLSSGLREVRANSRFPLFRALELRAVLVFGTPEGCWVRLLPRSGEWGKVLWWVPQIDPPACLAFALGTGCEHALVWAVHETMWMLWHTLQASEAA